MNDTSGAVVSFPIKAVRGWHGIQARPQPRYRSEDWQIWAALGEDSRLCDSVPGSPAWFKDLQRGFWVTSINDLPLDKFEEMGAGKVGDIITVRAHVPGLTGFVPVAPQFVLVPAPIKTKKSPSPADPKCGPTWKREQPVLPGKRVYQNSRPAFLEFVARHPHLKRRAWFLTELLRREWRKGIIVKHRTIADAAGCDIATVKRAQSCCQHFGVLRVISGRGSRKHNTYEVCWPAGIAENGKSQ